VAALGAFRGTVARMETAIAAASTERPTSAVARRHDTDLDPRG
jgi:hypothetical protein